MIGPLQSSDEVGSCFHQSGNKNRQISINIAALAYSGSLWRCKSCNSGRFKGKRENQLGSGFQLHLNVRVKNITVDFSPTAIVIY